MNKYYDTLKKGNLFHNFNDIELDDILKCIRAEIKNVKKNEVILFTGDKPLYIGIVLTGQLYVIREDYNGNSSLITAIMPGEEFAEAMCCADIAESPVTVKAERESTFLLLNFSRLLCSCSKACSFHTKLIENMLKLIARKNIILQNRMEIISVKSVREKVMLYLEALAIKQGRKVTIPFNREKMADYLCVDRSALSHELMKMKKDGLIEYKKNSFNLKI